MYPSLWKSVHFVEFTRIVLDTSDTVDVVDTIVFLFLLSIHVGYFKKKGNHFGWLVACLKNDPPHIYTRSTQTPPPVESYILN